MYIHRDADTDVDIDREIDCPSCMLWRPLLQGFLRLMGLRRFWLQSKGSSAGPHGPEEVWAKNKNKTKKQNQTVAQNNGNCNAN